MSEHGVSVAMPQSGDPFLMLTPAGALLAHAEHAPDETATILQTLLPASGSVRRNAWLAQAPERRTVLARAMHEGWVHEIQRELQAPDARLDHYLPHAIAGLSSTRMAALASDDGFCIARSGYDEHEAEILSAITVEFFEFMRRQRQRGWKSNGSISFYDSIDMLLPNTTMVPFWVDKVGYWFILGGEPLLNNRALVEVIWSIHTANKKFAVSLSRLPFSMGQDEIDAAQPVWKRVG